MNAPLSALCSAMLALSAAANLPEPAQPEKAAPAAATFSADQLDQLVAPIALHPDSLLTQILMASTYPLEIVEAQRWIEKNKGLDGKGLEAELKKHDWDPSVKALCGFAEVLKQMSDNLDWTQDLGDAFLGQKAEVLDAVQRMRKKALDSGNLKTSEQQKVSEDGDVIIIQSSSPEVVYVPTYSPTVVYGAWAPPSYYYPPMYAPPPAGYGFVSFTAGVVWGAAIWGDCDWGGGDVNIDIDRYNEFNRNTNVDHHRSTMENRAGNKSQWQHNPEHRKGVNYKSPTTAERFGGGPGASRVSRDQARGYGRSPSQGATGTRGAATPSTRDAGIRQPSAGTRDTGSLRSGSSSSASTRASSSRGSAFSGSRSSSLDRQASSRGAASRGSSGRGGGGRGGRR